MLRATETSLPSAGPLPQPRTAFLGKLRPCNRVGPSSFQPEVKRAFSSLSSSTESSTCLKGTAGLWMDLCWLPSSPQPCTCGLQGHLPCNLCLGGSFWPGLLQMELILSVREAENAMMKIPQVALFLWEQGLSKLVPPLSPFLSQS